MKRRKEEEEREKKGRQDNERKKYMSDREIKHNEIPHTPTCSTRSKEDMELLFNFYLIHTCFCVCTSLVNKRHPHENLYADRSLIPAKMLFVWPGTWV